ncbi:hypothetical protein B5S28_g3481 [[Candida] boidinii]|nr:hypothetical protein B5S28_g3481 [[Candida] boidinii]OWB59641.1 hypothetical protein B5S29_g501 [[Candida] boidinii]OWB77655.1 hypothetical protein B5S32_g1829 [[Candida] boidinii]
MKYSTVLSAAALASSAIAEDIAFYIKSDNELNGNGIYNTHEGAGINYWFASTSSSTTGPLVYDAEAGTITEDLSENFNPYFDLVGSFVAQSVLGPNAKLTFDDEGVLSINGTSKLYACNNVNDPYMYSTSSRAIIYGDAPNDACLPIELVKKAYSDASESSSAAPSTTSHSSSSFTTIVPPFQNTTSFETETTFSTETHTITSCSDNACHTSTEPEISSFAGAANAMTPSVFGAAALAAAALLI